MSTSEEILVLGASVADDIESEVLQRRNIAIDSLGDGFNAQLRQMVLDLHQRDGMLLVGVFPQVVSNVEGTETICFRHGYNLRFQYFENSPTLTGGGAAPFRKEGEYV